MRTQDPQDDSGSSGKTKRNVRRTDSIILAGFITVTIALAIHSCYTQYHRGLTNTHSPSFLGGTLVWALPLGVLVIAFFLYGSIDLVHDIIKLRRGRPANKGIALNLLIAFLPPISLLAVLILCIPSGQFYMRGFERWARENVDVGAIQQWLASDGAAYAGQSYERDSFTDLPPCLTQPEPWKIRFSDAATDSYLRVELFWGGKILFRSVVVGPETMTPESVPNTEYRGGSLERRFSIGPGAYAAGRW